MQIHAVYDNGHIYFKEQNLPKIKREIVIDIPDAAANKKISDDPIFHIEDYCFSSTEKDISKNHDNFLYNTTK